MHPAVEHAYAWIKKQPAVFVLQAHAVFKTAAPADPCAAACLRTYQGIVNHETVDGEAVLGLAWEMRGLLDVKPAG